jgi:hypothetical protein
MVTVFIAGCGSGSGDTVQPGVLGVALTDAPACGYDEVNVTVSRLRIHQSDTANENGGGWTDITLNPPRKINLLNLNDPTQPNFALENLGETSLAAGHYTQLRLVLVPNSNGNGLPLANSLVLSNAPGTEIELETPSGIQSGIKLIHQFDVGSGQRVDLLLDFDACKSIVQTSNGTYKLKPVIKIIPYVLNGIEGFIDTALFANQSNTNNNVNHVVVTAQVNGEVVRATVPNSNVTPNPNKGKFWLARLTPGVQYDVVITADGRATTVMTGVPVPTARSITTIATAGTPITLPVSASQNVTGTVTLNPADDDGTVVVAAKQTLNGGPTVTVKSRVGMVLTNAAPVGDYDYNLPLPIARPWVGSYATPLPVLFTEQPVLVGGAYSVYGSAETPTTVYATQTPLPSSVSITGGSATQDFTLTP